MASIIKKKVKNYSYYYLVESARVNGKPRIVSQKYLGKAEDIGVAVDAFNGQPPEAMSVSVQEFGAVFALYDLATRLDVVAMIDQVAPKRDQGLSLGQYMLLAAINRAVDPGSKSEFSAWFGKTVLHKYFPAATKAALSSQRFWDNMSHIDEEAIQTFEASFCRKIVQEYELHTNCLLYDTTNFFTYVDTASASKIPRRGNSKEKRADLKIVGLALMVSPDFNVPLFHEVYPGNRHDSVQFKTIASRLRDRLKEIIPNHGEITLVFDKGNNSDGSLQEIMDSKAGFSFRFVGSLRLNQCTELLDIPKSQYTALSGETLKDTCVYRVEKEIYKHKVTVVLTYNPELMVGQMQGLTATLNKGLSSLEELKQKLVSRANSTITKGRRPTEESVRNAVEAILRGEHLSEIIDFEIQSSSGAVQLEYQLDTNKLEALKELILGKTILFTDNHHWESERIVTAYRSQFHVEESFKQMKNTEFLSFRPMYHWTDQKIKVHAFYCVLAYRLCCLLNKELNIKGSKQTISRMLQYLSEVKEVTTVYPGKTAKKKPVIATMLANLDTEGGKMIELLNLQKKHSVV